MKTASNKIAEALLKLYPSECKIVKINMLHERAVRAYIMGIEKAHKMAAKSKLRFKF